MDEDEQLDAQFEEIAREVLSECRTALMMRFRFLDVALWKMPFVVEKGDLHLATNGKGLYFSPQRVIMEYQSAPSEAIRDMLHSILHCIFRHPFDKQHESAMGWSLTCDIVVESIAMEMCDKRYASPLDEARKVAIDKLTKICGTLSPKKLYRLFVTMYDTADNENRGSYWMAYEQDSHFSENLLNAYGLNASFGDDGFIGDELDEVALMTKAVNDIAKNGTLTSSDVFILEQLFARDSHRRWVSQIDNMGDTFSEAGLMPEKSDQSQNQSQLESQQQEVSENLEEADIDEEPQQQQQQEKPIESSEATDMTEDDEEDEETEEQPLPEEASIDYNQMNEPDEDMSETEEEWEDISRQIELELTSSSIAWDDKTGHLRSLLPVSNRKKYDYSEFLKQFMSLNEDMRISPDEFDYIFYKYGLDNYNNRPLVEPLEYSECNNVRDFVIAIDTSGSCSGALVRKFVEKTFDILKSGESFASKVNVHIIQCDSEVKSDVKIESKEDMKYFMDNFELKGFGGTDFRPVFTYVDELIENKEFDDLRGLIYFTDGLGRYPNYCPSYETAFIFMDDNMVSPQVPPWAMKVVLDEDEVRLFD